MIHLKELNTIKLFGLDWKSQIKTNNYSDILYGDMNT